MNYEQYKEETPDFSNLSRQNESVGYGDICYEEIQFFGGLVMTSQTFDYGSDGYTRRTVQSLSEVLDMIDYQLAMEEYFNSQPEDPAYEAYLLKLHE